MNEVVYVSQHLEYQDTLELVLDSYKRIESLEIEVGTEEPKVKE